MMHKYTDEGVRVVIEIDSEISRNVRIGVGDTWKEAKEYLETTPVQCLGQDTLHNALRWAYHAGRVTKELCDKQGVAVD